MTISRHMLYGLLATAFLKLTGPGKVLAAWIMWPNRVPSFWVMLMSFVLVIGGAHVVYWLLWGRREGRRP